MLIDIEAGTMGTRQIGTGREFIKFIRPILGIEQKHIRRLTITADIHDATIVNVECIGELNTDGATFEETAPARVDTRRFIFTVEEITDGETAAD